MNSKRAQAISAFTKTNDPEANSGQRIVIHGTPNVYAVYKIPTRLLIFNIRNGRFASELIAKERSLKRNLDPNVVADSKEIQALLLGQNEAETKALREDLKKNGQLDPGIVTFDGAVINANRRMAVLKQLHSETGEDKYAYLRASILPTSVDEKDLWRIEAGLQFAKDFRLEYGPVNELLKLKEGQARGLSNREISASLLGRFSEKDIVERLEVLKLIEGFLVQTNRPGEYQRINRNVEKFNSLRSNVIAPLQRKKKATKDLLLLTETAFALIDKTERSHWEIRSLGKIGESREAFAALKGGLKSTSPLKLKGDALEEAFISAKEVVESEAEDSKPERLLRRAILAVNKISPRSENLKSPEVVALLNELIKATKTLVVKR